MRVYVASSWKQKAAALLLAGILRNDGHEVDCFCDPSTGRFIAWPDPGKYAEHDVKTFMGLMIVKAAFCEDKKWLDWADAVVLLNPCGRSAHLEAGYAKGQGKQLYIIGPCRPGEHEVMYGFADGIFFGVEELREALRGL